MRFPPGMMPMMMMYPGGMPGMEPPQQTSNAPNADPVPTRVRMAFEFLSMLHAKEQKRGAVSDSQTLELDGIKPTIHEEGASEAACEMLAAYFRGCLDHDRWEKLRYDAMSIRVEHEFKKDTQGNIGSCPSCKGGVGLPCLICKGTGKVIMTAPITHGEVIDPTAHQPEPMDMTGGFGGRLAPIPDSPQEEQPPASTGEQPVPKTDPENENQS